MTTDEWVDLKMCEWDVLIDFLRGSLPKMGRYGREAAGDTPAIVKMLRDPDELSRIAREIHRIECQHEAAMAPLVERQRKISKDRADALQALRETIRV